MTLLSRAFQNSSPIIRMLVLGMLTGLVACAPAAKKSLDEVISEVVSKAPAASPAVAAGEETPEYYIQLARNSKGETRQQYLLKAAELLYAQGDIDLANDQLHALESTGKSHTKQAQIQLLAAKIALANHSPAQALELIPPHDQLNLYQHRVAGEIMAQAHTAMGHPIEAVKVLVKLGSLIETDGQRENNHEAIFAALSTLSTFTLNNASSDNPVIKGWLDLARIMRNAQTNIGQLQNNILDWGTQYTFHPVSNSFIDRLLQEYLKDYTPAVNIAVILPMQGQLLATAEAIKSGFLSAYYSDDFSTSRPAIHFYDSSNNVDFMDLYNQAILDGAKFVVGPLDKNIINYLAQQNALDIPILTLNYAEDPNSLTDNLFQFGLLPEDEARQVAELAIHDNKMNAAVLVPESEWGRRLSLAFRQRYEELGGTVLSTQQFATNVDDFSRPIKKLFNLQESTARHRKISRLLATELKFTPYRRQDIEMIFLAATHRSGRGIIPAFKFHHAGNIPVYATSHIYTGNIDRSADSDLNGVLFLDIPWTLVSNSKLRKTFSSNWPEQQEYTRLFALGIDSYNIMRNLNYLQNHEYARFSGETGNIYMDDNRRLHRELIWAKFRNGKPRYIDTTTPPKPEASHEADQS